MNTMQLIESAYQGQHLQELYEDITQGWGGWIDPKGKYHKVARLGHKRWIEQNAAKLGIEPDPNISDFENRWRVPAIRAGFIRVVTEHRRLTVQGMKFSREAKRTIESMASAYLDQGKEVMLDDLSNANNSFYLSGTANPKVIRAKMRPLKELTLGEWIENIDEMMDAMSSDDMRIRPEDLR